MLKLQVTLWWQHNDQEQGRGGKWDWGWRLAGDRTWADSLAEGGFPGLGTDQSGGNVSRAWRGVSGRPEAEV